MKRFTSIVLAAMLVLAVGGPALASQCPKLWKEADDKMASLDQNSEQVKKAKALLEESKQAHQAGNHPVSEQKAKEAIDLVKS
jgi:hypothetical protein